MNMNRVQWIALLTALAALAGRQLPAVEPWPVVEQPDLKQTLDRAPVLATESLGEPARGVNVWERWMVPKVYSVF
jgi:hypothetical protein